MLDLDPKPRKKNLRYSDLLPSRPVWPMPMLNGRAPVVLATNPKAPGIELAYQRANTTDLLTTYPVGSVNGTARHFTPNMMPAFAVRDGEIIYAGKISHAHTVVVDHLNGWATYYSNLEFMFASPTSDKKTRRAQARVKAGDVLGYVGGPAPDAFKCLHFQLWKRNDASQFMPIDAEPEMAMWSYVPWTDPRLTNVEAA